MAIFFFLFLLFVSFVSPAVSQISLTLADRMQAQEKIERIYYNHRIWSETNKSPKPPFEEMVPRSVIEKKVNDSLSVRITPAMLQAELDRIAKTTQDLAMLQELFSALNNDPNLIAETLVRPIVAQRMIHENKFVQTKKRMKKISFNLPDPGNGGGCGGWDILDASNPPSARSKHTAIWTGTEMIVWGGNGLNTGGRYDPALNTWTPTSVGADLPSPRSSHTAVWTGTEMIVWGGIDSGGLTNTGGRYNPVTDSWITTSVGTNVPEARSNHTAVWTGSEMIIWGGGDIEVFELNTGGRYDPSADSWQPTSIGMFVPAARLTHSAVWTGQEMIIWGGAYSAEFPLESGGRYNPISDSWLPTTLWNVPERRRDHTAIWTGSQMIIWGGMLGLGAGDTTDTGAMYDPVANQWEATPTLNAPFGRTHHIAVWTGTEMIIWSGIMMSEFYGRTQTGGRYSLDKDIWLQAPVEMNTPSARYGSTAIWTGSRMIVFGGTSALGLENTGAIFTPKPANIVVTPIGFDLPNAEYDFPYLQNISAITISPSNSPSTMTLVEGNLPVGLSFDGSSGIGVISGIPEYPGYPLPFFTITATDANLCSGSRTYHIYLCSQMNLYPYPLADGKVGIFYNQKINVAGINDPKFSITSGTLPDGLAMDETGLITGVPTTAGTSNFVVTATGSKCSKSRDYFINITGS